jgi:L-alanine-DL-glutamate epimerase-like enolase superfamily enzyme
MRPTTVVALETQPLCLPLTEPFAIASGAPTVARNLLVRVILEDGTVGIGEAAPFTEVSGETQESADAAIAASRELIVGQDARILRRLAPAIAEVCDEEPAARWAVEQALLDALLRHFRMPMWSYFGGHGSELSTDVTITAGDRGHAVAAARAATQSGFSVLKIKVGSPQSGVDEDVERVVAVAQAAPGAKLILDANGGYSATQALSLLDKLEAQKVAIALFEQPVSRRDPLELLAVSKKRRVPLCADESARGVADVRWLLESDAAQVVNLKLMKSGLFATLEMYHLVRSAGRELMIGGMVESVLAMSVSAHLAAGLGGFAYIDLDTPLFIAEHPFSGGFAQSGARLRLGHITAGHGVNVTD